MIRNDTCACGTSEKKEKEHTYLDHVTEATRLSTFIAEKTKTLGAVLFGFNSKEERGDNDGDGLDDLNTVAERQVEVLSMVNLKLDEILVKLLGYTPNPL